MIWNLRKLAPIIVARLVRVPRFSPFGEKLGRAQEAADEGVRHKEPDFIHQRVMAEPASSRLKF